MHYWGVNSCRGRGDGGCVSVTVPIVDSLSGINLTDSVYLYKKDHANAYRIGF